MKRIISVMLLILVAATCFASEIARNSKTGSTLEETSGVYSIKTKTGILILGDRSEARNFLVTAGECFVNKSLESFKVGDTKYTVHEDKDGAYIIKVGLGVVKVRESDVVSFAGGLGLDKLKKVWKVLKE